jgi:hypothetical protein
MIEQPVQPGYLTRSFSVTCGLLATLAVIAIMTSRDSHPRNPELE